MSKVLLFTATSLQRFKRSVLLFILLSAFFIQTNKAQNYEAQSVIYNSLIGGISGGVGALINKHEGQKWYKAFGKGFLIGTGGGALMYSGKKMNNLILVKHDLGYAWLSRLVFSAGNSIIENASANIDFWQRWHFDIGFIRFELNTSPAGFTPRMMPSMLGGIILILANNSVFKFNESLRSGTLVFSAHKINYAPELTGSTPSNAFIITNNLNSYNYYELFGHEMIHTFHFQELSGINYFAKPLSDKWKKNSSRFSKLSKWIYADINYELMLLNYFLINGGHQQHYNSNFLENEAEYLSTEKSASK